MAAAAVTVIGEALIDLVPGTPERTFIAAPGGSPYNVAIGLARLGLTANLMARLADNAFGRILREHATAEGVNLEYAPLASEPTTLAVVSLDVQARASYDFYLDGTADWQWTAGETGRVPPNSAILHFGSIASWTAPGDLHILGLASRLRSRGDVLVSYDPNVRPRLLPGPDSGRAAVERGIRLTHIAKASQEDVAWLYPDRTVTEVARRWLRLGATVVIVTDGANGADVFLATNPALHRPAPAVTVADTVGAGDAFTAGLLASLCWHGLQTPALLGRCQPGDLAGVVDDAITVAAMTCERPGADPPAFAEFASRPARLRRPACAGQPGRRCRDGEIGGMDMRLAAWRNRARTAVAVLAIALAGLSATGCAHQPASQRLAMASCIRFAVHAIERNITVRSLPAACQGLTRAQVAAAADTALAITAGKVRRPKRDRIEETRPLLGYPLASYPPQPKLLPVTTVESPSADGPPLALVALVTWLVTVGFGGLMLARWVARGRRRADGGGQPRSLPTMNVAHFGLALAGLAAWIGYLVTGLIGVAWLACALLLPVAGLGMVLVSRWFPERSATDMAVAAAPSGPVPAGVAAIPVTDSPPPAQGLPAPPPAQGPSGLLLAPGSASPPPAWHPPALLVVTHVAFATATILFAVLAAIAAG